MVIATVAQGCAPSDDDSAPPPPRCRPGPAESRSTLEGVYALTAYTHNDVGCDEEGPPAPTGATHVWVRKDQGCGPDYLTAVPCQGLESCQDSANDRDSSASDILESFLDGSDATGWSSSAADVRDPGDGVGCDGAIRTATLTGEPGVGVRISHELRTVTDAPFDDRGAPYCDLEAARVLAKDQPCEQLTVLTGEYVSAIGPFLGICRCDQ